MTLANHVSKDDGRVMPGWDSFVQAMAKLIGDEQSKNCSFSERDETIYECRILVKPFTMNSLGIYKKSKNLLSKLD